MARKKKVEPITEVAGISVDTWDDRWVLVDDGFVSYQPQLRHKIGLWAAKRGGDLMYVAAAANMRGAGLAGGLARVCGENKSGDKGSGKRKVAENIANVDAYVIAMDRSPDNVEAAKLLKKVMIQRHDPTWNQRESVVAAERASAYARKP